MDTLMFDISAGFGIVIFGILYFATHTLQLVTQMVVNWLRERKAEKDRIEAQKAARQAQFKNSVGGRR